MPAWMSRKRRTPWLLLEPAEGVTGRIAVRRTGDGVEMMLDSVVVPEDGHAVIVAVPLGYRPVSTPAGMNQRNGLVSTQGGAVRVASAYGASMRILAAQAGQAYNGSITWSTDDPMPGGA